MNNTIKIYLKIFVELLHYFNVNLKKNVNVNMLLKYIH